jgi:hypothetical protein
MTSMRTMKKIALSTVIASVVISGTLGIIALLVGSWGDLQTRVVLTTVTITATCLFLLCAAALRERGSARLLPGAGALLASVAMALALLGIWKVFDSDLYWKWTGISIIFAAGTAHLCLLSLARLTGNYRWALWAAFLSMYGLAFKVSPMILADNASDFDMRIVGVLAILAGCLSILIPIFHRICAAREEARAEAGKEKIHCPSCAILMTYMPGVQQCPSCGRSFTLELHSANPLASPFPLTEVTLP